MSLIWVDRCIGGSRVYLIGADPIALDSGPGASIIQSKAWASRWGVSMLTRRRISGFYSLRALACMLIALPPLTAQAGQNYQVYVSNDKSADAIGIVDVAKQKLTGKISAGSDPEEFSLSKDGTRLYISNEDVKTASVINIATGKVEHIVSVGPEPEGVATTPDGKRFYVTCEAGGDVYVIDAAGYTTLGHFKV